jgi:hypothetical protein
MNSRRRLVLSVYLILALGLLGSYAFADGGVVDPADFLGQVLEAIRGMGGVSMLLKISAVLVLVVSSMKVSFLNDIFWSKLGAAKVYVAPALGLLAGLLGLGAHGQPVSAALVFAYLMSGGGAVFLHEILDSIKLIPGLGHVYLVLIQLIEKFAFGPAKGVEAAKEKLAIEQKL